MQSLLLLLAPAFFAATLYMELGKIALALQAGDRCLIKPRWLTRTFVAGDVLSFFIIAGGGGIMAQGGKSMLGANIIVGGLLLQVIFFAIFIVVAISFDRGMRKRLTEQSSKAEVNWRKRLRVLYVANTLIMLRNVVRAVEYAQGNEGYLLRHELSGGTRNSKSMLQVCHIRGTPILRHLASRPRAYSSSSTFTGGDLEELTRPDSKSVRSQDVKPTSNGTSKPRLPPTRRKPQSASKKPKLPPFRTVSIGNRESTSDVTQRPPIRSTHRPDPITLWPVIPIRSKILEGSNVWAWWFHGLKTYKDAKEACAVFWVSGDDEVSRLKDAGVDFRIVNRVVDFNDIAARMKKLGIELPHTKILFALAISAREPTALKQYLRQEMALYGSKTGALRSYKDWVLHKIFDTWLDLTPETINGVHEARRTAQFYTCLTGRGIKNTQIDDDQREQSLFHMIGQTMYGSEIERKYIRLVGRIAGPSAVLWEWFHWDRFKDKETAEGTRRFKPRPDFMRNEVIRVLASLGDSSKAWRIAYERHQGRYNNMEPLTWEYLLRSPQHILKWVPEMDKPALALLGKSLPALESQLGVEWVGGEDGYHVSKGHPFWVREDMIADEP
ncbi:uncharacterized protein KY384_002931 [Bacidia gigantensis]|uniref:uncharacterized protein n=1 Tax=Bacidia gigantensis TaxID=2732470 RepID=UPI001D03E578|nr:uncharacterized protein KY384_002931 [Bacidia gigantensis]KAG8531303.1 hypothetical protein KY384_002931 [Bacidia gigantensis]